MSQRRAIARREFLSLAALGGAAAVGLPARAFARPQLARALRADLVVCGGGLGGVAAALAALRRGRQVILTEETDWVGGQLTQQAVPPDEHPWIESFGCTRSYRELRERIREHYHRNYPLTARARAAAHLNPGNGGVSRLCCEPRAALAAVEAMLAPWVSAGRLLMLLEHELVSASVDGVRVRAVSVRDVRTGESRDLEAPYFIDATELGDLLPLAGIEHVTGAESRRETRESHAPETAQPDNHQAFTACFAVEHRAGEEHTLSKPAEYEFWRAYVPKMTPPWTGALLSLAATHPITLEKRLHAFNPLVEPGQDGGLWTYRRILDQRNFEEGRFAGGVTLVNWPQNDYWLGNLVGVKGAEARTHVERSKQLSLSLLYWLQTEAPRPDGKTGWPGLRLRPDLVGTSDGLAKRVYVREARRIRAEFTVLEEHVGTDARMKLTGKPREEVQAERFADSVGVGSYRIDLHPSSGGDNYVDVSSLPFQIPLGALIPVRVDNLLPGCKNLGVTHITNGCYRLHPVEWNIGEAAGAVCAFAIERKETPRAVRNTPGLLEDFQRSLRADGFELEWPKLTPR